MEPYLWWSILILVVLHVLAFVTWIFFCCKEGGRGLEDQRRILSQYKSQTGKGV